MAERSKVPSVIGGVAALMVVLILGVFLFSGQDRGPGAGAGGGAGGATVSVVGKEGSGAGAGGGGGGGGMFAGSQVLTLVSKEPAVTVTLKLPGAKGGVFMPATIMTMGIPIKLDVLVTGPANKADLSITGVSRAWTACVSENRAEQMFLLNTRKIAADSVKLADGRIARIAYGSSFMAPALSHQDELTGDVANKGSKAFEVMITDAQGEIHVVMMGPVERESDLEGIAREIAGGMRIERGKER
jgi:hypothetical protein